jgi:hypothetical protein
MTEKEIARQIARDAGLTQLQALEVVQRADSVGEFVRVLPHQGEPGEPGDPFLRPAAGAGEDAMKALTKAGIMKVPVN